MLALIEIDNPPYKMRKIMKKFIPSFPTIVLYLLGLNC